MNVTILKPNTLSAQLKDAIDHCTLERARLEQTTQELAHAKHVAQGHTERLKHATLAEERASIDEAPKFAATRRDIQAMADAADRQVVAATAAHVTRQNELKEVERQVAETIDRLLLEEAEGLAMEIIKLEERAVELRERLLALPFPTPAFVGSKLIQDACAMPWREGVSRYREMLETGGPHRIRIANHSTDWSKRRAGLISGDITE